MTRAFVLGAGLGTRLKRLTEVLPKPLIPVWHRPLISYALEHLLQLGFSEFVINTHHLPGEYKEAYPDGTYRGCPLTFRHEPVLLETGGGLANVADLLQDEPFAVYNGDVLTDLPLAEAKERHTQERNLATLVLRSTGAVRNVAFDPGTGRVLDLRNKLGTSHPIQTQFTGLYFVSPEFFRFLTPGKIESVVEGFLRAIVAGERIGGVMIDDGDWWDLGDRQSYLDAHASVKRGEFPRYAPWNGTWKCCIHPEAEIGAGAQIDLLSCVGDYARIGAGATLESTLIWPGGRVAPGARLRRCIVRTGRMAEGDLADQDL